MSRDRLKEIKGFEYQKPKIQEKDFTDINLENSGDKTVDNKFFQLNDSVKALLKDLNATLPELDVIHDRVLSSINDNAYDTILKERDLTKENIRKGINDVKAKLNEMKIASEEPWLSKTQKVSRKGREQGLARMFGDFVNKYQQMNIDFNEKNKGRLRRQYLIAKPDATEEEIEEAINSNLVGNVFAQMITSTSSSRTSEARSVLRNVEQRHEDIIKTEKAILELAALFQEISDMIYSQQGSFDTIETAVEEANANIEYALMETEKAIEVRRSSRKVNVSSKICVY
ncbi:hypothetical protein BB560_004717 [Smittium megazygosporum]|uniref:t-SNARE coiled-coil homology domain-containing protein n=1 Tax=Smittium megazygosporum TaxID=133381 RepID=A0A2T9Z8L6_9FUNG|nr:hypothetical protein BB560_004717 [Smittium megazygosporum]